MVRRVTYAQVLRAARVSDLIEPLRRAFLEPAIVPDRFHADIGAEVRARGTLLMMPAWRPGSFAGVKIATVFPDNVQTGKPTVQAEYLLVSAVNGEMLALIDGRALTLLRTAALSALAGDVLAPKETGTLLMVGAGALAPHIIAGQRAVRGFERALLWARDSGKAETLASRLTAEGNPTMAVQSLEAAARTADVIVCATLSATPLIRGAWLKGGAHLSLIGSFQPNARESDDDCVRHAYVVADTATACTESGDLAIPLSNGSLPRDSVALLRDVLSGVSRRPSDVPRTVFKSVGTALADLAGAEYLYSHLDEKEL